MVNSEQKTVLVITAEDAGFAGPAARCRELQATYKKTPDRISGRAFYRIVHAHHHGRTEHGRDGPVKAFNSDQHAGQNESHGSYPEGGAQDPIQGYFLGDIIVFSCFREFRLRFQPVCSKKPRLDNIVPCLGQWVCSSGICLTESVANDTRFNLPLRKATGLPPIFGMNGTNVQTIRCSGVMSPQNCLGLDVFPMDFSVARFFDHG